MDSMVREHMKRWEGEIPYMYLDTRGYVTVGVGHLLADVKAAQALGFVYREDQKTTDQNGVIRVTAKKGDKATAEVIAADYASVQKKKAGLLASLYKSATRLELPDAELVAILEADVNAKEEGLLKSLPEYRSYPVSARLALLDMAFNLGVSGLINGFPTLRESVKKRDWAAAAKQCHRKGPSEERNLATKRLFLVAVQEEKVIKLISDWIAKLNRQPLAAFKMLLFQDTAGSTPPLIRPRVQRGK
jgi:GH24 family phage-related lysozyme (muramidase)